MKFRLVFLLLLAGLLCGTAGDWVDSYRTAKARAIRQNKKILIFFSGSDWCEAGRLLNRDLFRTAAFQRLASEKYILYNADFPKYTRLGQETEDRNKQLAARYGIHRFPAVVVVDPRFGSMLVKQVGMTGMTPKKLLEQLSKIERETNRSFRLEKGRSAGKPEP